MAATALTINMPQTGGTKQFSYNFSSCAEVNTSFAKNDESVDWYNFTPDYSNKEVTVSADTNVTFSARTAVMKTLVSDSVCDEKRIRIEQEGKTPTLEYLTFVANESGTFKFTNSVEYSLDDGVTWSTLAANTNSPTITAGKEIKWRATITPAFLRGVGNFSSTKRFEVKGNPLSLLYGDDFVNHSTVAKKSCATFGLFANCTGLTNIDDMIVPYQKLSEYCCWGMFSGCTSLTHIPSDLLPAEILGANCYNTMFADCTGLTSIPNGLLQANETASYCYVAMFSGCTSLIDVPSDLLMSTITETGGGGCYSKMFKGCTSLQKAPILPSETLYSQGYSEMFEGCTSLNEITCLATDVSATQCTYNWVKDVAANGTFYKNQNMNSWSTGNDGIPDGWTVRNYQP